MVILSFKGNSGLQLGIQLSVDATHLSIFVNFSSLIIEVDLIVNILAERQLMLRVESVIHLISSGYKVSAILTEILMQLVFLKVKVPS